jgi:hypothetical protein
MIELKVHCDCGQKYKFDVEPVNGRMPFTVACPICQRDGTAKANEMLQQMSVFRPVADAPAAGPAPAVPPPIPVLPAAPLPTRAATGRLRLDVSAAVAPRSAPASPPLATAMAVTLPPTSGRPRAALGNAVEAKTQSSFGMGILGAAIGALVGSILYFLIFRETALHGSGFRSLLALGVGGLAGWGANLLGKGEGSKELGGLAVVFTVVGVLAAQYFVLLGIWNTALYGVYTESVAEAKQVVKAIPTGSDAEIRKYLADQTAEDSDVVKPGSVSDDDVKHFRERELPQYQDLASGKITRDQYMAGNDPEKAKKFENHEGDTFKGLFVMIAFNMYGVASLVFGGGLAYKLSANA